MLSDQDRYTLTQATEKVSRTFNVPISQLRGQCRLSDVVEARSALVAALTAHYWNRSRLAEFFNCHHSSISHAVARVQHLRIHDRGFKDKYQLVLHLVREALTMELPSLSVKSKSSVCEQLKRIRNEIDELISELEKSKL